MARPVTQVFELPSVLTPGAPFDYASELARFTEIADCLQAQKVALVLKRVLDDVPVADAVMCNPDMLGDVRLAVRAQGQTAQWAGSDSRREGHLVLPEPLLERVLAGHRCLREAVNPIWVKSPAFTKLLQDHFLGQWWTRETFPDMHRALAGLVAYDAWIAAQKADALAVALPPVRLVRSRRM